MAQVGPSRSVESLRDWINYQSPNDSEFVADGDVWTYRVTERVPQGAGYSITLDPGCLIVATDGACPGNGQSTATRMGMGAYFGPNNPNNHHWAVSAMTERITNQRAEWLAAIWALRRVAKLREWFSPSANTFTNPVSDHLSSDLRCRPNKVVLKTDSMNMVNSMSQWIDEWRRNGFRTSHGDQVANIDLIQQLDLATAALEADGCRVVFWCVPREFNRNADYLANQALQEAWERDAEFAMESQAELARHGWGGEVYMGTGMSHRT